MLPSGAPSPTSPALWRTHSPPHSPIGASWTHLMGVRGCTTCAACGGLPGGLEASTCAARAARHHKCGLPCRETQTNQQQRMKTTLVAEEGMQPHGGSLQRGHVPHPKCLFTGPSRQHLYAQPLHTFRRRIYRSEEQSHTPPRALPRLPSCWGWVRPGGAMLQAVQKIGQWERAGIRAGRARPPRTAVKSATKCGGEGVFSEAERRDAAPTPPPTRRRAFVWGAGGSSSTDNGVCGGGEGQNQMNEANGANEM